MAHSHFALSWDAHRKNICNGLSTLQQNGEFVDMTLAADGHFVKVHQVIVALASPFIKELLASAPCPHPVLFLNVQINYFNSFQNQEHVYNISLKDNSSSVSRSKSICVYNMKASAHAYLIPHRCLTENCHEVQDLLLDFIRTLRFTRFKKHQILRKISYTTLCALLEYIYTGEVYVAVEDLIELSEAAKELHIKGLEDIKLPDSITSSQRSGGMGDVHTVEENDCNMETLDEDICYFEISNPKMKMEKTFEESSERITETPQHLINQTMDETYEDSHGGAEERSDRIISVGGKADAVPCGENSNVTVMQYTVSNQGSLQMILNRYIYYLKHTNRNNSQQWRCVDYLNNVKCPAHVITKNGVVVLRISAHTHPFHDKRILKKVHAGAVFSAIHDAEQQGISIKRSRGCEENEGNNSE